MKKLRELLLKYVMGNLGNVFEASDKVICTVDNSLLNGMDTITLNVLDNQKTKLIDKYFKGKEFYYIIDGHNFDKEIIIYGYNNCKVLINNCQFNKYAHITIDGDCHIGNTYMTPDKLFLTISATNTELIDTFISKKSSSEGLNLCIKGTNNLRIINSQLGRKDDGIKVSLHAGNVISLQNASILSSEVVMEASSINADEKTSIKSNKIYAKVNEPEMKRELR